MLTYFLILYLVAKSTVFERMFFGSSFNLSAELQEEIRGGIKKGEFWFSGLHLAQRLRALCPSILVFTKLGKTITHCHPAEVSEQLQKVMFPACGYDLAGLRGLAGCEPV